ncbi:MAG: cell wall-binding repeat-containing protein, partial [Actinomycetota bacterium]|nr:cell wall-binding repeat-containing protein [Actinomycetota bacterium]
VQRVAGATRFETAVAIAREIGVADAVLLSTGLDFPDALTAGAAAPQIDAVVLLTNGAQPHPATLEYLGDRAELAQFAVGGPAVAAHPSATPVMGASRYETAAQVARTFFADPAHVGVASGEAFPDALAGGAHIGRRGGPLLLTARYFLPSATWAYLHDHADSIAAAYVYGGPAAVDDTARSAIPTAFS